MFYSTKFIIAILVLVFSNIINLHAGDKGGYKDIRFGMTIDHIKRMGICHFWKQSKRYTNHAQCYEIGGEPRTFTFKGIKIFEIQIDLGKYTRRDFDKLSTAIGKKYKQVFRIDLEDAVRNNNMDDLECFHDNKIALRQAIGWDEGEEISKIFLVYTKKPYKFCKQFAPLKDVSSDDF
ncbi:hypothetical protein OAK48_01265 [Deltaproteobacteria bacterium]|nr:hypothetical protein [Deltaproteobacteria bacterium]